jgi:hypothetical protein
VSLLSCVSADGNVKGNTHHVRCLRYLCLMCLRLWSVGETCMLQGFTGMSESDLGILQEEVMAVKDRTLSSTSCNGLIPLNLSCILIGHIPLFFPLVSLISQLKFRNQV